MMTRRDFRLVAGTLHATCAGRQTIDTFADALATTNPAFDRARFVQAALHGAP